MKLTKKAVDGFKYKGDGQSRDVRWDDRLPGFGVRIYPAGRKAFILSYRANGRKRLMTLGTYGPITLEQGRNKARSLLGDITNGGDPLEARKRASQEETIKSLCQEYLKRHHETHNRSWAEDKRRFDRHIIPRWGNIKVKSIKRNEISKFHEQIGETAPYEANRILALLSSMFEQAQQWGFLEEKSLNPARKIKKFKEKKRDRWVTPEELPRLVMAIDQEKNVYIRGAFWLYLLLGVRKAELLNAKWQDIDLSQKEMRLPQTKSERTHYLPLSEPAIQIIKNLPKLEGNPYLLPGQRQGLQLVNISKPWDRVRKKAKVEDVRLHDLRRTLGSWLAQSGNSLHLIGRVLNHSNPSTTAIYARFGQDHVREALESHGKQIMGIAGKAPIGEVIKMKRGAK